MVSLDSPSVPFGPFSNDESGLRTSQSISHVTAEAIYRLGLMYLQKNLLSEVKDSAAVRCNRCMGKAMDKAKLGDVLETFVLPKVYCVDLCRNNRRRQVGEALPTASNL